MSLYGRLVNWVVPDAALRLRLPFTIADVDRIARKVMMPDLLHSTYNEQPLLRMVRERA